MQSTDVISERELIHIKISDLKFDKTNPNKLTQEQMAALNKSMQRFGYLTPIVIDQNNVIADGEHRALVYKQHGLEEIPAFKVELNTDAERRMLRQTMNKLRGEHDRELDANELVTIFQAGQLDDLTALIAQDKEDLQRMMLRYHPGLEFINEENQDEIDKLIDDELKRIAPDTQLGDLYQLGNHRLICGDCTDNRIIDKLLNGQKVDMVLTDPPYGIGLDTDLSNVTGSDASLGSRHAISGKRYDPIKGDDERFDAKRAMSMFEDVPEQFWFGAEHYVDCLPDFGIDGAWLVWEKRTSDSEAEAIGSSFELCWSKQRHKRLILRHRWFGFTGVPESRNRAHPTQKPTSLLAEIMQRWGKQGNNVLDSYAGSGSSVIACEKTDRNCYAVEIDPHYVDITIKRWEMYTGKKAVRIS